MNASYSIPNEVMELRRGSELWSRLRIRLVPDETDSEHGMAEEVVELSRSRAAAILRYWRAYDSPVLLPNVPRIYSALLFYLIASRMTYS